MIRQTDATLAKKLFYDCFRFATKRTGNRHARSLPVVFLLSLVWVLPARPALGIEPGELLVEAPTQSADETTAAELRQAVRQLGDASFSVRMSANRRLLDAGVRSLPYLRGAVDHPDRELTHRVKRLVTFLEKLELKQKVDAFARSDSPDEFQMPCWEAFSETLADESDASDSAIQALFAKMLLKEMPLLKKAASDSDEVFAEAFSKRLRYFAEQEAIGSESIGPGELSALLFCFDYRKPYLNKEAEFSGELDLLIDMTRIAADSNLTRQGAHQRAVEDLMKIALIDNERIADEKIVRLAIPAAVPRATLVAKNRDQDGLTRLRALGLISKVDGQKNIPIFESLFDEAAIIPRFRAVEGEKPITTTLGDYALYYAIRHAKLNIEDFGIEDVRHLGFESEESRKASRERWRELHQLQDEQKVDETESDDIENTDAENTDVENTDVENTDRKKRNSTDVAE